MPDYILLVEDNGDIREMLARVLSMRGYHVRTASDGVSALEQLRDPSLGRAQLIILDMMIPGMSGYDFCDEQKRDSNLVNIPVLIMTGQGDARRTAQTLGAAAGVNKPFRIEVLEAEIAKIVSPNPTR